MAKETNPNRIVTVDGRRRRPWALSSRDKILAAAVKEITKVGFERAKLVDIAKRAGMTAGSVYTWFDNKEDLFQAALEDALTSQIASNASALEGTELADNPLFALAALVPRNYRDTGPTDAQMLLIESYYAAWRDPKARKKLTKGIHTHLDMYKSVLGGMRDKKLISPDIDIDALATMLLAIPTGLSMLSLAGLPRVDDAAWTPIYTRFFSTLKR